MKNRIKEWLEYNWAWIVIGIIIGLIIYLGYIGVFGILSGDPSMPDYMQV